MSKRLRPNSLLRCRRKYQIIQFMESGGFSDLYLGRNTETNRKVVIKILKNEEFDDLKQAEQYWRRERAFISIQSQYSPHALQLIDSIIDNFNPENPKFIFITSYIKGQDFELWLYDFVIQERPDFYKFLIKHIFIPLCDYFSFIHGHGLIHRDFSPGNIMITKVKKKTIPVVIDWGASLNFDPATLYDEPKLLEDLPYCEDDQIYTPGYAPPEIDMGKIQVPQSDIYSFGMILHFAINGGNEPKELKNSEHWKSPIDWEDFDYPEMLQQIVKNCIQYEPIDRYLTFEDIQKDLKKYLTSVSSKKKSTSKKVTEN